MFVAHPQAVRDGANRERVRFFEKVLERPGNSALRRGVGFIPAQQAQQELLEQMELCFWPICVQQPLSQFPGGAGPNRVQFHDLIAKLVGGQTKKGRRTSRFEMRSDHGRAGQGINDEVFRVCARHPAAPEGRVAVPVLAIEQLAARDLTAA